MRSTRRMTERTAVSTKQDGRCVRHFFLVTCPDDVGRATSWFDLFVLNVGVELFLCNSGGHRIEQCKGDQHVQSRHRKDNKMRDKIKCELADTFTSTFLFRTGNGAVMFTVGYVDIWRAGDMYVISYVQYVSNWQCVHDRANDPCVNLLE